MATGAIVARILSQYNGAGTKAAKKDLLALSKGFDRMAKKSAKAFGIAAAAGAAFAVKVGVDSVKAAVADEKSQALLANTLRNTTGANKEVIASIEDYIDKAQRALGITDDELRPAFAKLASITGNTTQAQGLLGIAMDVSAGATVDMATATNAVVKATQGNFKALRNMGVQLDATTIKTKDVQAALAAAAKTFGGAAATRAETFEYRMKRVGIAFSEAKETLGNALMPTIESFFQLLTQKVIPAIQTWLTENGDKLVAAFQMAIKAIFGFAMVLYKTFDFVARNKDVFVGLGVILTSIFAASKAIAFVTAIQGMVKAFKVLRAAALGAAAAEAAATGGLSVTAAVAGIAAFAATAGGLYLAVNKVNKEMDKAASKVDGLEFSFDGLDKTTTDFLAKIKNLNVNLKTGATATGKLTAEQLKLVQTEKTLAALKKLGVSVTAETDPIQLEAARLNLVKQGAIAEQERIKQMLLALETQNKVNEAVSRYGDILTALADKVIDTAEVNVLAVKWGMTREAVLLYIQSVVGVGAKTVDSTDVDTLAAKWGISKSAAQKYLDFFAALNDGKLSADEIANLGKKWGMTADQVKAYSVVFATATDAKASPVEIEALATKWGLTTDAATLYLDFFTALNDGKLSPDEIVALTTKWGLTKDQVIAYSDAFKAAADGKISTTEVDALAKSWGMTNDAAKAYITEILKKFGYSASLTDAPDAATKAWGLSFGAVTSYTQLINGTFGFSPTVADGGNAGKSAWDLATDAVKNYDTAANASVIASKAATDAITQGQKTNIEGFQAVIDAAINAAAKAAEIEAAAAADAAAAIASAAEAAAAAADAGAAAAAAALAALLNPAGPKTGGPRGDAPLKAFASGGIVTSPTLALIGEAGPEAVIPLSQAGNSGFGGGSITINVQGSVISEGDLVNQIRNALLQGQNSGLAITKSAVAL